MMEKTGTRQSDQMSAFKAGMQNIEPMKRGWKTAGVKVLGITGGIGAGKSTILIYLKEKYNAHILEADAVGHLVQQPDTACWERIVSVFGADILRGDRTIDRGKLGAIVYADRAKLDELNAIVHPAVKAYICQEIAGCGRAKEGFCGSTAPVSADASCEASGYSDTFIVIEAALLLEDHYDEICDEIWYIYADKRVREERLMQSRGYTREKVRQIMQNQLSEEEFRRSCQTVIDNSGSPEKTYEQMDLAIGKFLLEQSVFD
ncbi:MAG: dephospho-CoA kinase [Clostridiales bacterium]|nr:dephospho-CoA kinase [Clostridiales bacterium]